VPDVRDVLQSSLGATHTIERELGGGGMSRVFVAEERALRRKVVVKTLSPDMSAGVSFERFKREIMLAAQLQHPHIAPLLAAGEAEGVPNAKLETLQENQDWRKEKVTYDTPYGERTAAYVFLPQNVRPPYQALVFFPSARVLDLSDSRNLGDTSFFDFVVQSGRAVIYPVYQDTYERRVHFSLPGNAGEKELYIQRSKDVARAIDYLQSRPDIAHDDIGYLGVSMGSAEGVVYATLAQDRLRAVVFLDGGYFLSPPAPGTDQADFAPRLKKPVLMVNGRYDFTFSLERAQEPLFRMLGTPAADKQHVVFETPHDVRQDRPALISVVLGFLDKYLSRVR